MPILFQICVEGNRGSTGTIAEAIGKIAITNGWSSYIAYGRFPRPSVSKTIKIGGKWSLFWHGLITRLFDLHCFGSTYATKKLIRQIREINPDIIHLHHIHGYYINMVVLFKYLQKANIPVVWTFHDCWSFTGHCAYFDFVGCDKWKTGCYSCPQKTSYPSSILFDLSKNNYQIKKELFTSVSNMTIVPVSNWLSSLVKVSFFSDVSIKVVHNGIDVLAFSPQLEKKFREERCLQNDFIVLGVADPWVERKGLADFIELSKIVDSTVKIVLIGLNEQQLKKLPPSIIGMAKTENREQLIALYSEADVFINPTWEDNFPTTNLEALSCGTPVITYNTGGSIEALSPETGIIVERGNVNSLKDAIHVIKKNGKSYYSAKCRERAVVNYNKENCFLKYFDIYQNIAKLKNE